jgi:hypothetical protein
LGLPDDADNNPLFTVRGRIERPFFDRLRREDPLLRWTALRDVNLAEAVHVELAPQDTAVASDKRGALIVRGKRGEHRFVALAFDVRVSDLPLRVAWPLLLLNAIDGFTHEAARELSSYRTGELWHVPVPDEIREVEVQAPGGKRWRVPVTDGRLAFTALHAGLYPVRAGAFEDVVAVNAPRSSWASPETDPPRLGERTFGDPSSSRGGMARELWPYLVIAGLLLLVVEWFTYQRRWTV